MNRPLYQRVALKRDLPEHGLKKGDVATLVEYVPHSEGGEQGCVLEVFNALGESMAVVAVRNPRSRASMPVRVWPSGRWRRPAEAGGGASRPALTGLDGECVAPLPPHLHGPPGDHEAGSSPPSKRAS